MRRMDRFAHYGWVGLIMAAFALVTGIVAAPVLQPLWAPNPVVALR
jgi:hypothetical protein